MINVIKIIINFLKNRMIKTKEYLISTSLIFLGTILIIINLKNNNIPTYWYETILIFLGVYFSESIYCETKIKEYNQKKIGLIISGIIAFLITSINFFDLSNIIKFYYYKIIFDYIISFLILTIYVSYKNSNENISKYVTKVFNNIVKKTIIYFVLAIGFLILILIFNFLIMKIDIILELEILLLGFFYIPSILYSLSETKIKISTYMENILKFIINILVIIAYIVIYIYIIKILILREIPSNEIFKLLTALFIFSIPISIMISSFKENKLLDKISNKIPILFIPFIFLQLYTLGIRIINNGLTEIRYIGIIIIIIEIIFIIIYIINKEKIGNVLIILIILINITILSPFINMFSLSELSQYNMLKLYEKNNLTNIDKEKIIGAFAYLNSSINGDKYINKILDKKDIEKINSWSIKVEDNIKRLNGYLTIDKIDINGYSKLYEIDTSNYNDKINIDKFIIKLKENNIDLSTIIKNYIAQKDFNNYFENNNIIILNDEQEIIIKELYIEYNDDKIISYNIKGYLLEK